jgi:hypothetical protein
MALEMSSCLRENGLQIRTSKVRLARSNVSWPCHEIPRNASQDFGRPDPASKFPRVRPGALIEHGPNVSLAGNTSRRRCVASTQCAAHSSSKHSSLPASSPLVSQPSSLVAAAAAMTGPGPRP